MSPQPDPTLLRGVAAALADEHEAPAVIEAVGDWLAEWADRRYEARTQADATGLHGIDLGTLAGRRDEAEAVAADLRRAFGLLPR